MVLSATCKCNLATYDPLVLPLAALSTRDRPHRTECGRITPIILLVRAPELREVEMSGRL